MNDFETAHALLDEAAETAVPRCTWRAVEEWCAALIDGEPPLADTAEMLGLDPDPDGADWPAVCALWQAGAFAGTVVAEPRLKIDRGKAERDMALDRPTLHLAPQWRHPLSAAGCFDAERGAPAILLPVAHDRAGESAMLLSRTDPDFENCIADIVALPLDGGRPLSLTGYSTAVGDLFAPRTRLVLYGGGRAWLEAWLRDVRGVCADTPNHLVERLHMPFAPPDAVLAIEPRAREWRPNAADGCCYPETVREIACADSRKLALLINALMRKKEKRRPLPQVLGPENARPEARAA